MNSRINRIRRTHMWNRNVITQDARRILTCAWDSRECLSVEEIVRDSYMSRGLILSGRRYILVTMVSG